MEDLLYRIVGLIAKAHNRILALNDAYEYNFTDKELHFLVIGIVGMAGIFLFYPLFKALADHGHVMVVTWIYVFTLILGLTFAIEIGQGVLGTGNMEQGDITYGIMGFLFFFAIFAVIRLIVHGIIKLRNKHKAGRYYS